MLTVLLKNTKSRYLLQDPGLLKTRQALRTVIAAIIATAALAPMPTLVIVSGALVAGYVSQGIYGESRREQQKTFFISASLIIGYFALCSLTALHFFTTSLILLASSFLVFYIKGVSPRFMTFPMYVWLMGFTGTTITPPQNLTEYFLRVGATVIGCTAAYLTHFYILPVKRDKVFYENINQWFEHLWEILFWLESVFTENYTEEEFHEKEEYFAHIISTLYRHNQNIIDAYLHESARKKCSLEPYFLAQYLSIRSTRVLINSIKYLHLKTLPPEIISGFKEGLELLRETLSCYSVYPNKKIILQERDLPKIEAFATRFEALISKSTLSLEEDLIYSFNFILGFRQLTQNIEEFTALKREKTSKSSDKEIVLQDMEEVLTTSKKFSFRKTLSDLNPTTRMAIQAVISISIALTLEHTLNMERSYWAVLTSVVLISQTWGASIKKSYERVFMTIIGGSVGTAIFFLTKGSPYLNLPLLLTSAYFSIYFYEISYLATTFFVSNFVVYFFAQLQGWTVHLFFIRALETCVGALIAVLISTFVLPIKARSSVQDKMIQYLHFAKQLTHLCLKSAENPYSDMTKLGKHGQTLYKLLTQLRQQMEEAHFEVSFKGSSRARLKGFMADFSALYHYLTTLINVIPSLYVHKHIVLLLQGELSELSTTLDNNFDAVMSLLKNEFNNISFSPFQDIRAPMLDKVKANLANGELDKADWFEFYSLIFFVKKVNDVLINIESSCLVEKEENK